MSVLRKLLPSEAELVKERGHALILTGATLDELLAQLAAVVEDLASAPISARARLRRIHDEVRTETEYALWKLIVQREALGLTRHDDVFDEYRVPKGLVPRPRMAR